MKTRILLALVIAAIPLTSFAHGTKAAVTAAAVDAAIEKFGKEEAAETIAAFTGVKGWPSGAALNVKVYLSNATKEINYTCQHMDHGGQMMVTCTK